MADFYSLSADALRLGRGKEAGEIFGRNLSGGKTGTILLTVHQSTPSEIHKSSFVCLQLWCELGIMEGTVGKSALMSQGENFCQNSRPQINPV
jgi:hypothetical protein